MRVKTIKMLDTLCHLNGLRWQLQNPRPTRESFLAISLFDLEFALIICTYLCQQNSNDIAVIAPKISGLYEPFKLNRWKQKCTSQIQSKVTRKLREQMGAKKSGPAGVLHAARATCSAR